MMDGLGSFQAEVFAAHRRVANRGNVSGDVLLLAYSTNGGNFAAAVTSAIGTLGGIHGPLAATQLFLEQTDPANVAHHAIASGQRIPGWGSNYTKEDPDPDWSGAHQALLGASASLFYSVEAVTRILHQRGKRIQPNPSCYTACLSILMGLPSELAVSLFLEARLPSWRKAIQTAYHSQEE